MLFQEVRNKSSEEYWNIITHLAGLVLAFIGMIVLIYKIPSDLNDFRFVSVFIFSISSMMVYAASCIYHFNWDTPYKPISRTLDHIAIYYLIAGSYTPFLLITFPLEIGWKMIQIVWFFALAGTLFKFFYTGKYEILSLIFYVLMGWTVLLEFRVFIESTPVDTFYLILLGAAFYLSGIIFYRWKSLKYNHAYWHLFVIAGNLSHLAAVYTIL